MQIIQSGEDILLRDVRNFDITQTLECGQCFHFVKLDTREYAVVAYQRLLHIKQTEQEVIFYHTTEQEYDQIWKSYFDLERDYEKIQQILLARDDRLQDAIGKMAGVRILQQDFFETLISFIISQNKQIPHIKQIVAAISKEYGTYLGEMNGQVFYAFPTVAQLSAVSEEQLRACKVGFRAPYIMDAVAKVAEGAISEQQLQTQSDEVCMQTLQQIKGVGSKVANCVALFGLAKRSAFPVDVWIKRIMETLYFDGNETNVSTIERFAKEHFGKLGGYAQQYLFYYGKTTGIGVKK